MSNVMSMPSVGPYVGVSRDQIITPTGGTRTYRILLYGAYNAMGLIGSEYNGIAVLDETDKAVVSDNILSQSSGYFGPSQSQIDLFDQVTEMNWDEFRDFVNKTERCRFSI